MKRKNSFIILILILLISLGLSTTFAPTTLKKMVNTSTIITVAEVISIESKWDDNHQRISTFIKIKLINNIKGKNLPQDLIIEQRGGKVGDDALIIDGSAKYEVGEEALFFIIFHRGKYWLHSMSRIFLCLELVFFPYPRS